MEKIEKFDYNSYLREKYLSNNRLYQVQLDVTYRCNANCYFCFQCKDFDKGSELSYDEIEKCLVSMKENGVFHIGVAGGEPFVRDDIIQILSKCKTLGFYTTVVTNGQLLNEKLIDQLYELGLDSINVSFHSIEPEKYAEIFEVDKNYYNIVMNNIKYMLKKKMRVGIMMTITNDNIDEVLQVRDFFCSMGIPNHKIAVSYLLESVYNNITDFRPNKGKIIDAMQKDSERMKEQHVFSRKTGNMCSAGRISCVIGPYGDVTICPFFNVKLGNIRDKSLHTLWSESKIVKEISLLKEKDFKRCTSCSYFKECKICIGTNINETGSLVLPSQNYCDMKKTFIDMMR